jgi:hypothetical protein
MAASVFERYLTVVVAADQKLGPRLSTAPTTAAATASPSMSIGPMMSGCPIFGPALSAKHCGKRGADVRPDFNWNRKQVSVMGYR